MCWPVPCGTCGRVTWAGCGDHVDEVRAMVRPEDWCPGHDDLPEVGTSGQSVSATG
jgi:hypothetical protein